MYLQKADYRVGLKIAEKPICQNLLEVGGFHRFVTLILLIIPKKGPKLSQKNF